MFCCGNCFSDRFLGKHIQKESKEIGNCSFCGSTAMARIEPTELADIFQQVIDLYSEVTQNGHSLVDLLRRDWHLLETAEIRPHKGDIVSVAEITVNEKLTLADLRNPRKAISPFELTEDDLNQLYVDIEYLCKLGEELTKPILPRDAHLEYLPTQYLCEFIKHCGFDGVVYKSSVGEGDNYAIFYDDKLAIVDVSLYEIRETKIKAERKEKDK